MEPDVVAGQWKNFEFKMIGENEYSEVFQHLRENFYRDEPIQALVGMTEERANNLDSRVEYFMKDNLSIIARDVESSKVAGVLIISHNSKDKEKAEMQSTSPLTNLVRSLMIKLESKVDIYKEFEVDYYAEIFIVSISREYRIAGLATELYKRALSMLSQMGYTVIESVFSNPLSRKIGEKLGFKELARLSFSVTIPQATDEFVNLTVLKL